MQPHCPRCNSEPCKCPPSLTLQHEINAKAEELTAARNTLNRLEAEMEALMHEGLKRGHLFKKKLNDAAQAIGYTLQNIPVDVLVAAVRAYEHETAPPATATNLRMDQMAKTMEHQRQEIGKLHARKKVLEERLAVYGPSEEEKRKWWVVIQFPGLADNPREWVWVKTPAEFDEANSRGSGQLVTINAFDAHRFTREDGQAYAGNFEETRRVAFPMYAIDRLDYDRVLQKSPVNQQVLLAIKDEFDPNNVPL